MRCERQLLVRTDPAARRPTLITGTYTSLTGVTPITPLSWPPLDGAMGGAVGAAPTRHTLLSEWLKSESHFSVSH